MWIRACLAAAIGVVLASRPLGATEPRDLTPVTRLEPLRHEPVEIVRDGQPRAVIYVADPKAREPHDRKRHGEFPPLLGQFVDEMVETIRLATGATLTVVDAPPAAGQPAIVIGDCPESRAAGIDALRLPVEGFVVKTAPHRVYLVGSTQPLPVPKPNGGPAWAVADFLERFVGVRWYWPTPYGGRSVERLDALVIPPVHYSDQPVFPFRRMYQDWYWVQARACDEQLLPMPPGVLPAGATTIWMGHHMRLVRGADAWPYDAVQQGARVYEYASGVPKTDEAIFRLKEDGTRDFEAFCYGAPETLAFYLAGLDRAWGDGGAGPRPGGITKASISVWAPMDAGGRSLGSSCHCATCRAAVEQGGGPLVIGRFLQRLCAEVKRRWPGKTVIYAPWADTQCPTGIEFPDNLVITALNMDVMGLMCQRPVLAAEEAKLRAWSRASGRPLTIWTDFASPSDWTYGPVQFPHLVRDFYRDNRDALAGSIALSYGGACHITAAPTSYVWMRALWNPDLDVDATLDEMCRRLFGPGAPHARELLRLQCDRWQRAEIERPLHVGDNRIPVRVFREIWPPEVVARMKSLRDAARAEIEAADDDDARKAFLYWTWTFDAFVAYATQVETMLAAQAAPVPVPVELEDPAAAARFHGGSADVNQIRVGPVRREDGPAGRSDLRFDVSWADTWRAAWTEPAARTASGRDEPVETWTAAWIFAKYRLPGADGYAHATLAPTRGEHAVPAGAALDVGLTDGKGMGVFVYRSAVGQGTLNLENIRLRWLHEADGVADPAAADLKVFAIEMVHVPRGGFAVGSTGGAAGDFTAGSGSEAAGRPFLVDEAWSRPAGAGPARRIGDQPGRLWSVAGESIGPEGVLADAFPTGHEPFYCMRYEVTRGAFADFLNAVPRSVFEDTTAGDLAHAGAIYTAAGRYGLSGTWPNLKPAKPHQACNLLSWWDGAKYAAWAGLRPMTELEYEKACRGPRAAVPGEYAWGTAAIVTQPYTVTDEGLADERIVTNYGSGTTAGNAQYDFTMPDSFGGPTRGGVGAVPGCPMRAGIFATPESGRIASGASYWGILELSGNVREPVVTVGHAKGRAFRGTHGNGTTAVPEDWPAANYSRQGGKESGADDAVGSGLRGGFFGDLPPALRSSDRSHAVFRVREASFSEQGRQDENGWRGVRTAP